MCAYLGKDISKSYGLLLHLIVNCIYTLFSEKALAESQAISSKFHNVKNLKNSEITLKALQNIWVDIFTIELNKLFFRKRSMASGKPSVNN